MTDTNKSIDTSAFHTPTMEEAQDMYQKVELLHQLLGTELITHTHTLQGKTWSIWSRKAGEIFKELDTFLVSIGKELDPIQVEMIDNTGKRRTITIDLKCTKESTGELLGLARPLVSKVSILSLSPRTVKREIQGEPEREDMSAFFN